MLFSSLEFLVLFLPLTLVVALRLHPQPLLRWVAFVSVVFYAFAGHWWFILPMRLTTVVDKWVATLIAGKQRATLAPERLEPLPGVGLAAAIALSLLPMNYGSEFRYLPV